MDILHAKTKDLLELVDLEQRVFITDKITFGEFATLLKDIDCNTIVMRENGFLSGYGMIRFLPKSSTAWLYSLCSVTQKAWIILNNLEIAAKLRNMKYIRLEVRPDNLKAITFYERNGYRLSKRHRGGRLHHWYEDGSMALVYIKDLR